MTGNQEKETTDSVYERKRVAVWGTRAGVKRQEWECMRPNKAADGESARHWGVEGMSVVDLKAYELGLSPL